MVDCTFHLENNQNAIYVPGQELKGQVILTLDQPKTVRSFILVVYGFAKCNWTEHHTEAGRNKDTTEHFEGKNVYLESETIFFGAKNGPGHEMSAGTHRYNFQCHLPENLPENFEAEYGHIRYYMDAKLDVPWKFDKEFRLPFTIARNDDLNNDPELRIGLSDEETKRFCCCCCESDPLTVKASIPCGGFAGAQKIPIKIEYFNNSDVDVERTNISLRRHIKYNSEYPRQKSKHEIQLVDQTHCDGALKMSNKIHEVSFWLPRTLVNSNYKLCKIVQVSYDVKVEAVVAGIHLNIDMLFPITIGTVPLDLGPAVSPSAPLQENVQASAPPSYEITKEHDKTDLPSPPPSFEEATKQDKDKHAASDYPQPIGWSFDPTLPQ